MEKNKGGRPRKEIDDVQLRAVMRFKPTLADTAAFFDCGEDTMSLWIKNTYGLGFQEFREQNMVHTRFTLIRKAISMAEGGNVPMLIFALKNLCGWNDKPPDIDKDKPLVIRLAYNLDDDEKPVGIIVENQSEKANGNPNDPGQKP